MTDDQIRAIQDILNTVRLTLVRRVERLSFERGLLEGALMMIARTSKESTSQSAQRVLDRLNMKAHDGP